MSPLQQAKTPMPSGTHSACVEARWRPARAKPFSPFDTGLAGPAQDEEMGPAHMASLGVNP